MFNASTLLPALFVFFVVGAAASAWLMTAHRRRDEAAAGIRALAGMRWREFSGFVLDAMRHRGYDVETPSDERAGGQIAEFLLGRNGQRWLLSCKHGSAYRIAAPAITELASVMRVQGASGALLATPGVVEPEARKLAQSHAIELIDGSRLWPELAPLLPPGLLEGIEQGARSRAKRLVVLAWLGALAVAMVAAMVLGGLSTGDAAKAPASVDPATFRRAPATTPRPAPGAPAAAPIITAPTADGELPPEQDLAQRAEVARAVSAVGGVAKAAWTTRSTLLVNLAEGASDNVVEVCAVLQRYPHLRTSRVHFQPPPGSEARVRFLQCATY